MTRRKAIPVSVMVATAIRQSPKGYIQCALCGFPLYPDHERVLEHMTPHAILVAQGFNPDVPENLRWAHKVCATTKTNGTPATCASGDTHKIAKAKRLAVARAVHDAVKRGEHVRPASRIKGRGFPKVHRPMRRPT